MSALKGPVDGHGKSLGSMTRVLDKGIERNLDLAEARINVKSNKANDSLPSWENDGQMDHGRAGDDGARAPDTIGGWDLAPGLPRGEVLVSLDHANDTGVGP